MMNAEQLAQFFHETYDRLSGQERSWAELGDDNKATLIAAMREVLCKLFGSDFVKWQEQSAKDYEKYRVEYERQAAEQARICACGHAVSYHLSLAAPDSTPYLLCTVPPYTCGDFRLPGWVSPRCSIPTEVPS